MSNEPFSKCRFALDQRKIRWLNFKNKIMKNNRNIKDIQQKQTTKINPSFTKLYMWNWKKKTIPWHLTIEDYPWPQGTICIVGDSVVSGLQPGLLSQKHKVKVKSFSSANVRDIIWVLRHKPEYIMLHVTLTVP